MSNLENDDGNELPFDFNLHLSSQSTKKKGRIPHKANIAKSSKKTAGSDIKDNLPREDDTSSTLIEHCDDNPKGYTCEMGTTRASKKNFDTNIKNNFHKENIASKTNKNSNGNDDGNNHKKLRGRNVAIPKAKTIEDDGGQDCDRERTDKKSRKKVGKTQGCSNKKSTSTKKSLKSDAVTFHSSNEEDSNEDDKDKGEMQIIKLIQDGPSLFQFKVCYDLKYPVNPNSYTVRSEPRGMVLICNIINVVGERKRRGSEFDVINLKNLFLRLGYKVKITEDCSAANFKKTLKQESTKKALKNMDSFIIFIMTHGKSKDLFMQDGEKIQLDYVEDQLDGKNAPLLINKPKLIFVQACRNEQQGQKIEHDFAMRLPDKQPHGKADIFISHSTYEGSSSARMPDKGSWFIRTLVKVLEKHAHDWSYSDIMLCVHRIVNEMEGDIQQIPQKTDSGRYNFFFSPIQIPSLISQADVLVSDEEESPCSNETLRGQDIQPTDAAAQTSQVDIVTQARTNMILDIYNRGPPVSAFDLIDMDVPFLF